MALTVGDGPFGSRPAGRFNFPRHGPDRVLYLDPSPRRLRAVVVGEVIADTVGASLLHETGRLPVYYVPWADVRTDLLERSTRTTRCPLKGDASHWHVVVDGERRQDAVWGYPEPVEGAPRQLAGLVALAWDAVDEWYEEAERIHVHPRDPYHRVDVVDSDRHVVIRVGDVVVAESTRPTVLFETSLRPRYYLREEEVRTDLLEPSDTVTSCPYKGTTTAYWHVRAGDRLVEDAVWVYGDPTPEAHAIAGLLAFYDEKVALEVHVDQWTRPGAL